MKRGIALATLATLALALAACGHAPTLSPRTEESASTVSTKDIPFVKDQIQRVVRREFQQLDQNHDGKLSKQELGKKSPLFLVSFQTVDVNLDGFVTYEEFLDRMASNMEGVSSLLYAFLDRNGDGVIRADDWSKYLVAVMDSDRDGTVSFPEFQRFVLSPAFINPAT
ncbi:MAG: EF-hand domain-containing protein [Bacteroidota bacterium]